MRDVGGKLADLLEGCAQAIHHSIEGGDEMVEFVAGAARRDANVQIRAGDFLRCLGHRSDRPQRPAGHEPAPDAAQADEEREDLHVTPVNAV